MSTGTGQTARIPGDPRPFAEFRLAFVLGRAAGGTAFERLHAVERTLGALIRRWRTGEILSAGRDIRLSPATRDELVEWVETGGALDARVIARLGVYHSGAVTDPAVPPGWVRVYLDVGRLDPGLVALHQRG